MKKIKTHQKFDRNYRKRILPNISLDKKFKDRLLLFISNSFGPILKDHALLGKKISLRSFSVTGDIRVVYVKLNKEEILLLDIGSHNQVY